VSHSNEAIQEAHLPKALGVIDINGMLFFLSCIVIAFSPLNAYRIPLGPIASLSFSKILCMFYYFILFTYVSVSTKRRTMLYRSLHNLRHVHLSFMVLITSSCLMTFHSLSVPYAIKMIFLSIVVYMIMLQIVAELNSHNRLVTAVNMYILASTVLAIMTIYQSYSFFFHGSIPELPFVEFFPLPHEDSLLHRPAIWYIPQVFPRFYATLAEPNSYGVFLAISIALSTWVLINRNRLPFSVHTINLSRFHIPLAAIPLILTLSRSGWLTLFIGITVLIVYEKRITLRFLLILSAVFVSIFIVFHATPEQYKEVLSKRVQISEGAGHVEVRSKAIQDYFLDNPIVGVGYGSYGILAGNTYGVSSTHSYYVTYLVEGGIFGFTAFLYFVGSLANHGIRRPIQYSRVNLYRSLGASIITMVIFNNILYHTFWLEVVWVGIGLAFASVSIGSRNAERINGSSCICNNTNL